MGPITTSSQPLFLFTTYCPYFARNFYTFFCRRDTANLHDSYMLATVRNIILSATTLRRTLSGAVSNRWLSGTVFNMWLSGAVSNKRNRTCLNCTWHLPRHARNHMVHIIRRKLHRSFNFNIQPFFSPT
ncbi:hypothetical protein V8G54_007178, partial [Vigna mungo]